MVGDEKTPFHGDQTLRDGGLTVESFGSVSETLNHGLREPIAKSSATNFNRQDSNPTKEARNLCSSIDGSFDPVLLFTGWFFTGWF